MRRACAIRFHRSRVGYVSGSPEPEQDLTFVDQIREQFSKVTNLPDLRQVSQLESVRGLDDTVQDFYDVGLLEAVQAFFCRNIQISF